MGCQWRIFMNAIQTFSRYLCALIWMPLGLFLPASPALATAINDYDGDCKSDLAIYDESNGDWTVLFSSLHYAPGAQLTLGGIGWRPAPGDYDGDGTTDMAIMGKTGAWWMYLSGSTNYLAVSTNFGIAGAGPVPADYDGDEITDLAYYEKASGEWGILFSESGQAWHTTCGPGFIPASADFDGDDKADLCVYKEATGE